MIIAIDGPAASGKGTLGRRLAEHYGLRHLDTGLTYRAVAAALLASGAALDDVAAAVRAAEQLDFAGLDGDSLKRADLGEAASRVAVIPAVRAALMERQRAFADRPPGAVLDGRDIGTVVRPDAAVKLYVTADAAARARRRAAELAERGSAVEFTDVLADIVKRDARDSNRSAAPLRQAPDAYLLDTTEMDIEAAFRAAVNVVERVRSERS